MAVIKSEEEKWEKGKHTEKNRKVLKSHHQQQLRQIKLRKQKKTKKKFSQVLLAFSFESRVEDYVT